ncbi:MAG: Na/Pi symporter [Candidatus Delongbacteria bacterium]|jgi:sodium-dependent phosphate cotransporter|nr:Na/Pi symporter [Candidatus Delongbacteria bacterium]
MIDNKKQEDSSSLLLRIIGMLFFLWLFLLSIKLLGGTFKNYFSDDTADLIKNATDNPLVSLFIGILATAIIQSSSSTTSIIVAFVGAGTLSLHNAIPMIMGANIGTSITGILVSFGQMRNKMEFNRSFSAAIVHDYFNWFAVLLFLPLEIMTGVLERSAIFLTSIFMGTSGMKFKSPLDSVVKPLAKQIEYFVSNIMGNQIIEDKVQYDGALLTVMVILSLILLFVALNYMSAIMKKVLIGKFERIIHKYVFNQATTALLFGTLFTVSVQSSSITISIVVPLVGAGILSMEQIFPYAVGANIGTTITGILAALVTGNVSGISIALVHTLFNIFAAVVFIPLKFIPIGAANWFASKAGENKLWAIGYALIVFFIIPLLIIFS